MRYVHFNDLRRLQFSNELRAADVTDGPSVTSVRDVHLQNVFGPMVTSDGRWGITVSLQQPLNARGPMVTRNGMLGMFSSS